ncbi:MAG: hypothetical protein IT343_06075 [Candidatus Melainabacteria bacterium]|nr:hypothetical protein [Candidatus Melainabacteria bacterium]
MTESTDALDRQWIKRTKKKVCGSRYGGIDFAQEVTMEHRKSMCHAKLISQRRNAEKQKVPA